MLNLTHVTICGPNRSDALGAAAALLTVSLSARSLRLSALAQVPEKTVFGTLPITPVLASYISQIDFFKEEGASRKKLRPLQPSLVLTDRLRASARNDVK